MGEQNKIGALLATAEPLDSLRSADRKKVLKGGVKTIEYFMYVRKSMCHQNIQKLEHKTEHPIYYSSAFF